MWLPSCRCLTLQPQMHDHLSIPRFGLASPQNAAPFVSKQAPLLEAITTSIRRLNLVAQRVRQRDFSDLMREVGLLCRPAERAAEPCAVSPPRPCAEAS
jgi:hypothetical protein